MPDARLELKLEDNKGNQSSLDTSSRQMPRPGATNLQPLLYIGTDPSVNTLTLTLTLTDGAGFILRGSDCAAQNPDPVPASILVIPDPQLIDEQGVARVKPDSPPGWCCRQDQDSFSENHGWRFTPEKDIPLTAALEFKATFPGILANRQNLYSGLLTVTTSQFPSGTNNTFNFAVDLAYPPKDGDQPLNIAVDWIMQEIAGEEIPNGEVIINTKESLIDNELHFALINKASTDPSGQKPLVPPEKEWPERDDQIPTFSVYFLYARDTPGDGALATIDFVKDHAPKLEVIGDDHHKWIVSDPIQNADLGPHWTMSPNRAANQAILGSGTEAAVQLKFSGVQSNLPLSGLDEPDLTFMYITWQNIPGYLPDGTYLEITKVDTLKISELTSQPSYGEDIHYEDEVVLSWTTRGAESSYLKVKGDNQNPPIIFTGDGHHQVTVKPTPEFNIFEVFAVRQGQELSHGPISFNLLWRLEFTRNDIKPPRAITHWNQFTVTFEAVAPVGLEGQEIELSWKINYPDFVDYYELTIGDDDEHPISIPEYDPAEPYKITDPSVTKYGISETTEFHLKAIPKFGPFEDNGATVTQTIAIYPPLQGFPLEGIPLDVAAKPPTKGWWINDYWLLLGNVGDDPICQYQIKLDPNLATYWFLYPDAEKGTVSVNMTKRADPFSFTMTLERPFDVFPFIQVRGLGGDCAKFYSPRRVASVDQFLAHKTFTARVKPPVYMGGVSSVNIEITFDSNLNYRTNTTTEHSESYEYYFLSQFQANLLNPYGLNDPNDPTYYSAGLGEAEIFLKLNLPEVNERYRMGHFRTMDASLNFTNEGDLKLYLTTRFWEKISPLLLKYTPDDS